MSKITDIVKDLRNIEGLTQPAQEQLVSGTNIKTVNGDSILGSGNIDIITPLNDTLTSTSTTEALTANQGKILQDTKQNTLISGTNIKTIAGASILGSGNLEVGGGGLKSVKVFTSSGTWIKPAGINLIKVYVTGGGGAAIKPHAAGGGGGAGGTAIKLINVSAVSSQTVVVGAGGTPTDTAGGTSSFGTVSAMGGLSGGNGTVSSSAFGGLGGTASGGDININGGDGGAGTYAGANPMGIGGSGGASYFGSGGSGGAENLRSGRAGIAYGSGGGSSIQNNTPLNGANGIVIVEEYA